MSAHYEENGNEKDRKRPPPKYACLLSPHALPSPNAFNEVDPTDTMANKSQVYGFTIPKDMFMPNEHLCIRDLDLDPGSIMQAKMVLFRFFVKAWSRLMPADINNWYTTGLLPTHPPIAMDIEMVPTRQTSIQEAAASPRVLGAWRFVFYVHNDLKTSSVGEEMNKLFEQHARAMIVASGGDVPKRPASNASAGDDAGSGNAPAKTNRSRAQTVKAKVVAVEVLADVLHPDNPCNQADSVTSLSDLARLLSIVDTKSYGRQLAVTAANQPINTPWWLPGQPLCPEVVFSGHSMMRCVAPCIDLKYTNFKNYFKTGLPALGNGEALDMDLSNQPAEGGSLSFQYPNMQHVWQISGSEMGAFRLENTALPCFAYNLDNALMGEALRKYHNTYGSYMDDLRSQNAVPESELDGGAKQVQGAFFEGNGFTDKGKQAVTLQSIMKTNKDEFMRAHSEATAYAKTLSPDADPATGRIEWQRRRTQWQARAMDRFSLLFHPRGELSMAEVSIAQWAKNYQAVNGTFFRARDKVTLNLNFLQEWWVSFMCTAETVFKTSTAHLPIAVVFLSILNVHDSNVANKLHFLGLGEAELGKSHTLQCLERILIPGTCSNVTFMTDKAHATEGSANGMNYMQHETSYSMLGVGGNKTGVYSEREATTKHVMTEGSYTTYTIAITEDGRRKTQQIKRDMVVTYQCLSNCREDQVSPAVASRFFVYNYAHCFRENRQIYQMVCFSETVEHKQILESLSDGLQWMQGMVSIVFKLIHANVLEDVVLSFTDEFMPRIMRAAELRGIPKCNTARHTGRLRTAVRTLVIMNAVLARFASEQSPYAVPGTPSTLDDFLSLQGDLSDTGLGPSVVVFALGLLRTQWDDPVLCQVVEALIEKDFPPRVGEDGEEIDVGLRSHPNTRSNIFASGGTPMPYKAPPTRHESAPRTSSSSSSSSSSSLTSMSDEPSDAASATASASNSIRGEDDHGQDSTITAAESRGLSLFMDQLSWSENHQFLLPVQRFSSKHAPTKAVDTHHIDAAADVMMSDAADGEEWMEVSLADSFDADALFLSEGGVSDKTIQACSSSLDKTGAQSTPADIDTDINSHNHSLSSSSSSSSASQGQPLQSGSSRNARSSMSGHKRRRAAHRTAFDAQMRQITSGITTDAYTTGHNNGTDLAIGSEGGAETHAYNGKEGEDPMPQVVASLTHAQHGETVNACVHADVALAGQRFYEDLTHDTTIMRMRAEHASNVKHERRRDQLKSYLVRPKRDRIRLALLNDSAESSSSNANAGSASSSGPGVAALVPTRVSNLVYETTEPMQMGRDLSETRNLLAAQLLDYLQPRRTQHTVSNILRSLEEMHINDETNNQPALQYTNCGYAVAPCVFEQNDQTKFETAVLEALEYQQSRPTTLLFGVDIVTAPNEFRTIQTIPNPNVVLSFQSLDSTGQAQRQFLQASIPEEANKSTIEQVYAHTGRQTFEGKQPYEDELWVRFLIRTAVSAETQTRMQLRTEWARMHFSRVLREDARLVRAQAVEKFQKQLDDQRHARSNDRAWVEQRCVEMFGNPIRPLMLYPQCLESFQPSAPAQHGAAAESTVRLAKFVYGCNLAAPKTSEETYQLGKSLFNDLQGSMDPMSLSSFTSRKRRK
jgi:hypothetical protein